MRNAFSMIELIFVIVILGILSAIALPKFSDTADEARHVVAEDFVGTLNRVVAPSMWLKTRKTHAGSVKTLSLGDFTQLPEEFKLLGLNNCASSSELSPGSDGEKGRVGVFYKEVFIFCIDGDNSNVPQFGFAIKSDKTLDIKYPSSTELTKASSKAKAI